MPIDDTLAFCRNSKSLHPTITSFTKDELNIVLATYGRMVSHGVWSDYGISHLARSAVFSIFRSAADFPIYRIEKQPHLHGRQAMYQVIGMDGRIFRRSNDLQKIMLFFEAQILRIAS